MFKFKCILCITFSLVSLGSGIYVQDDLKNVTKRHNLSPAEWAEPFEDGLWSTLLEEYTLKQSQRGREGRIIQTVTPPQFPPQQNSQYSSQQNQNPQYHKYIPTSGAFINRRIGEAAIELEPNLRRPPDGKVITVQKPSLLRQGFINSPREVSETDLYLLGAIEKLVYRVDYMEKRLKRTEQLVYYLMAGNNQQQQKPVNPCPTNFTKVGETCYHFGVDPKSDWKDGSTKCRAVGAYLAEFDKLAKYQDVVAHLLSTPALRGHDFWLGGLNPGLLWIWAGSARPVNPNANMTSLGVEKTESTNKIPGKVLNQTNKNETVTPANSFPEIKGDGRCLRLSFNPSLFNYGYTGHDCSAKHNFICEFPEKSLENEINRIAKELNFE